MPGGTTDAHANGAMGPNAKQCRARHNHMAHAANNPIIELAELSEAECPALPQQACELRVHEQVGSPKGFRAVGLANNKNPLPIVVPCHRVIGADGKLVGYAGGVKIKKYLLDLEGIDTSKMK